MSNKLKILITGGAGFIGTNLADHYLSLGHHVTIYDNLSRPGVTANLDWIKSTHNQSHLGVIVADILDTKSLKQAVINQDIIFHQAGQTAVTTSLANPIQDFKVNAEGSFNLLEAIRLYNPKAKAIFASTNKVYGDLKELTYQEEASRYVCKPQSISESQNLDFHSPYGCSKGAADQYFLDYARSYNLNTIVFRQSCIYGEHQLGVVDQGWVAHFALQAINKQPLQIFGTGKQVRDILYINDLVQAYDLAISNINATRANAYNIGGGFDNSVSLIEVIQLLESELNSKIDLSFAKERIGDQKYYVSDTSKASHDFSWSPHTKVSTGLKQLITWLNKSINANNLYRVE